MREIIEIDVGFSCLRMAWEGMHETGVGLGIWLKIQKLARRPRCSTRILHKPNHKITEAPEQSFETLLPKRELTPVFSSAY